MDVSKALKYLLYEHDCVIVPNLGGFVCAHKKLEFNFHAGLIHPPRKTVAFNQNLNNNDGLLANYIVNKNKVGHSQALENINAWVSNLHHQLQQGQTVNIQGLGSFSLNNDKKVVFVPFADVNFSIATYGLGSIQLGKKVESIVKTEAPNKAIVPPPQEPKAPIIEKEQEVVTEAKEEEEKTTTQEPKPTIPPKRKPKKGRKIFRRIFAVVFTLILFFSLFILQDYAYHAKMDKGSMLGFDTPSNETPKENTNANLGQEESNTDNTDETVYTEESKEDDEANSLENSTVAQGSVETSPTKTAKTDSVFYIIAGAFSSESNANDLLEDLNRKGFSPEIINVEGSALYRVGYQRYPSRKKAEGDLNSVRNKTHNFAAWVLAVKP